jgi:hypothetical protein
MPFDGEPFSIALHKLDQAIALLSSPERWGKGAEVSPDGRFCIMGALRAVGADRLLHPLILRSIAEVLGQHLHVQEFNDSDDTDHALMLKVLGHARTRLALGRLV